jgi:hypothetical protein
VDDVVTGRKSIVSTFVLLGYSDDPALQLQCARNYIENKIPVLPPPMWTGQNWRNDKIRVAYLSRDDGRARPASIISSPTRLSRRSAYSPISRNRSRICPTAIRSMTATVESPPTRQQAGLPEKGFVFCSFNNNWKITPEVFDVWMRLLQQVEGSVLWLLSDNDGAERNLRKQAQLRGGPSRAGLPPISIWRVTPSPIYFWMRCLATRMPPRATRWR